MEGRKEWKLQRKPTLSFAGRISIRVNKTVRLPSLHLLFNTRPFRRPRKGLASSRLLAKEFLSPMSNRPQWWWPPVCGGKEQGRHNPLSKLPCPRFLSHIMAQVREFPQFLCDSALLWWGRGHLDKFTSSPFLILP